MRQNLKNTSEIWGIFCKIKNEDEVNLFNFKG